MSGGRPRRLALLAVYGRTGPPGARFAFGPLKPGFESSDRLASPIGSSARPCGRRCRLWARDGALRAHFFAASFGLDTTSGGSARRCPSVCERFLDAGTHSRQLHAAQGLDLENRAKLCAQAEGSTCDVTLLIFCVDASDGSRRSSMSGARSRVFLPCPSDAYAEPPGWLVWSLRSGRMAARVVFGLDTVLSP